MGKLKIPSLPVFETKLPSTGKTVKFRPLTVKEESFLLLAKETEKEEDIQSAIRQTISSCVEYPIKKMKLIDLEWLFLQIRIKSVSNEVELAYRCTNILDSGKVCGAKYDSIINLEQVELRGSNKIAIPITFLSGEYVLTLIPPPADSNRTQNEMDVLFSMVESIMDPTGEMSTKDDITTEEFTQFLETFTNAQMQILRDGISKLISLNFVNHLECPVCGVKNTIEYRSLNDFFG